jgi:hypothetical protein
MLLDKRSSEPAHSGISRDAGANDAAADDQDVEWSSFEPLQRRLSCVRWVGVVLHESKRGNKKDPAVLPRGLSLDTLARAMH